MKRIYVASFYTVILLSLVVLYACKNLKNKYTSPNGYDLTKPDKFNMPSSLLEISGIALNNGNSDTIYSVQDEDGKIFKQQWDVKKQTNTKFAPKGDFEDLAIFKDKVFVLKSSGTLYSFPLTELSKEETSQTKERKRFLPKGEYESIYADAATNKIYVACKDCEADKKKKQISGYIFDYEPEVDTLISAGNFVLDLQQITQVNPKLKAAFRPSAFTRNPKTNEWYFLSSMNKMLLITDSNWKITAAHHLNSSTFNQPEGITFDKNSNLYISNEGDEITDGNILKFKYAIPGKK